MREIKRAKEAGLVCIGMEMLKFGDISVVDWWLRIFKLRILELGVVPEY